MIVSILTKCRTGLLINLLIGIAANILAGLPINIPSKIIVKPVPKSG